VTATITSRPTRAGSRIVSTGSYRPARIITNDEVCTWIESSDEWIRERSGIVERRWAADDESVSDMGTIAAAKAIAAAGLAPTDISVVIVASVSHPYVTPSAAVEIAERVGAVDAAALDVSAACAGFCYAIGLADSLIRSGESEHVLVVGVEKLSDFVDKSDRGSAFIFADGAGAVVVSPSERPGIGPTVWGADGSQRKVITMTQSWVEYRDEPKGFPALWMEGQKVFRWAVGEMSKVAEQALTAAGITSADLAAFVPHQANNRITDALVKYLQLPEHVVVARDIITTGNTSSASVPLALDRMLENGEIQSGGLALIIGFGAGLAFAAQVIEIP